MNENHILLIADELKLRKTQVESVAVLLEGGGTVPFIARYRKEATGSLDEVMITSIRDQIQRLEELDKRREAIIGSLQERELLTDELKEKIDAAPSMTILEDIYLPFRPKRRTRATIAREKGLEPLAKSLFEQTGIDEAAAAAEFVDEEKGVASAEEALAGARDIIAEWVSENEHSRERLRALYHNTAVFSSRLFGGKETEAIKYKDYFEWSEPAFKAPSHRILAMLRGRNEKFLVLSVDVNRDEALDILYRLFLKGDSENVRLAIEDGLDRLLAASMEREVLTELKTVADAEAIKVFTANLRELLLAPPLGQKSVLALDPGFRTGCKIVCLDKQGQLMHNDVIYLHNEHDAETKLKKLCAEFKPEAIAIGNGTASRETKRFVDGLNLPGITVVMVNESGASVYSASKVARDEFPDYDVTVRGSVSIGRRLMDPLAELVKIDPKSIGVGQYQHDVDQAELKKSLDDVVMSCVNNVGVEVNTASKELLTYVSGLGPQLAENIVKYRDENGPFEQRGTLKKVPRLGPKAFEQAAGFLRIRNARNPLDGSAVHPESYHIVKSMAADTGCDIKDLMSKPELRAGIKLQDYVSENVGLPTLTDIVAELAKPGRDPREKFEIFEFASGVEKITDVTPGMKLPGIVTNVTAFGAFVDIGVHQDGLVHISQLANRFVKDPNEIVKVHQKVMVTVLDVDVDRKRISLSMRDSAQ